MGQRQSRRIHVQIETNSEEIARMDQKMVALEQKTVELEQAARAMSTKKAEYEQKLADMSKTTDKRVLEKTEIQKAECEQRLAIMSQTMDKLVQEKMEDITKCQQIVADMSESMDKRVLEITKTQKAECEQRIAVMSQTMDKLVQEKMEGEAQKEQILVAVRKRTLELEQAARAICVENAQSERKLVAMSEKIDKLVLEKTEEKAGMDQKVAALEERNLELQQTAWAMSAEKAEYEQKLADMSETIVKQVLEKMEIQKAECEQRLAVMSQTMDRLVQEKMEEKAECQQKLADMLESIDKRVLEKMETQKAECEQRIAITSQTWGKLVQEEMEDITKCQQQLADMSRSIYKQVWDKMETQKAECEQRIAITSQTWGKLVQEEMEDITKCQQQLADMSRSIYKQVWDKMETQKAECEQRLAVMTQTMDKLVQEKMEENAQSGRKLVATSEKIDKLVLEKTEENAEHEQKLVAMSQTIEKLVQEKTEAIQAKLATLSESIESINSLLLEKRLESVEFQEKPATVSEKIDLPLLMTTQEKTTVAQLQEEVRLPPPEQSLKQKGKTQHCEEPEETSDERLLDPDLAPELKKAFMLLSSDEGTKIINGLELIQELAQNQTEVVIPKVKEVCVVILREVLNPWVTMSNAALMTLSELLRYLEVNFDPYLDWVVDALLQKAASDIILREAVNEALGQMILSCDPICCAKALLNGLRNQRTQDPGQEAAVRECVALHLLELVEYEGDCILSDSEQEMLLRFRDLTQDASEVVRCCAERILSILQRDHFSP